MTDGWTKGWFAAAALALGAPVPGLAQAESESPASAATVPAEIPTSAFAARSPYNGVPILSPDGRHIAYTLSDDLGASIGVIDPDSDESGLTIPLAAGRELQWYAWAGNERLLWSQAMSFSFLGIPMRLSSVSVTDIASGRTSELGTGRLGAIGDQVVHLDPQGEFVLLSMQPDLASEPDVWRFRLDGNDTAGERIEHRRGVRHWIADNAGVVRIGLGVSGNRLKVWYRKTAGEEFRVVAKLRSGDEDEMWDLARLISGSDEGLVLEPGASGRLALRRFNYATREVGEVIHENPDWDLSAVELDEAGAPLAVHFTDDRDRTVWLDPAMARLQERLARALGGEDVHIIGRARDGSRLLVAKGGASDPGAWYVYKPEHRELQELTRLRPELDPASLASVEPVSYTARDGTAIHAYLTVPRGREARNLPLIVLPHGGPYGIRDKLSYSDTVQLLANRGYAVLQPNYRGSAGYGAAFEELGNGEVGRRMQDDLDDAVDWAAAQGIADPRRVCIVGISYGGYAALWGVIRNPERYRCAASFAGVTEWDKQLEYDGNFFDRKGRRAWRQLLRGADRRFDLDSVSPARRAAQLTRPVLLVHGKLDGNVPFSQFEIMRRAIEKADVNEAEFLVLENSGHGFANARDEQAWYDALIGFLARHNPPDAAGPLAADQSPEFSVTTSE